MNVCVIGTGYVGLVVGLCLAETGNDVICVDIDESKIERLKNGEVIIYEPGIEPMMKRSMAEGRLQFTTDIAEGVRKSLFNFIAVGTPPGEDGSADLQHVLAVAKAIGQSMDSYKIIINKSTVPVGTADMVRQTIARETNIEFDVVSNPEFLKEGGAVSDFMKPDRVVIGTDDCRVGELMKELYSPFVRTGNPILIMDIRSAEMTKYASNAMLATRISFMNELSCLCDRAGADIEMVRKGMSTDSRIGHSFLFPGAGYGGSCFPKDVKAIIRTAQEYDLSMDILNSVEMVNERQKRLLGERIIRFFSDRAEPEKGDKILGGKKAALWGLSFKPQTDDMREAPSVVTINQLLKAGAAIRAYDPAAMEVARGIFGDSIEYGQNVYDCLPGADCLVIITEWNEFRRPNYEKMKELMKLPVVFDGRNLYDVAKMKERGFQYFCIGRGAQGLE
ncbi:UDP-glucose/GDP-mannose dehydrogenase family protein [bacterium]|nr:UDP-glucose/GDP-mannose dehydrogenase family protein [bacterium]